MDLEQFDEAYGAAEVAKSSGDLPDGKYIAQITDTDLFESKDGRPYFKITLKVTEGDLVGATTTKIHNLDNPERFKFLKTDLVTCGLFLNKISDLPKTHEKIRGITLNVASKSKVVGDKTYTNLYLNSRVGGEAAETKEDVPF